MTIILGIDPGSRTTGFGVIEVVKNKLNYLGSGSIHTQEGELASRLLEINDGIFQVIREYRPTTAAIEQVFMHKNAMSALKLGHARGVAMVAMASHSLAIGEYSPRQIKQAVVGTGSADKHQVQTMVLSILGLTGNIQADAADGLAVAICHCHFSQGLAAFSMKHNLARGRLR